MGHKGSNDRTQDRVRAARNNEGINWPLRKARAEVEQKAAEQKEGK